MLYLTAFATALFMLRLLGASWDTHFPAAWPDAVFPKQGYLAVAAKSPFRPSFYFAFRPIGYPLLLWFFGRSAPLTVIAQTAIYSAVVIALCATAFRVMHSRAVAVITSVLVVGMAVQAKYAMWNTQILSESLAISLGFAVIAAWWRFAAKPTLARVLWGYAFVVAWLLVRDAHVLPATVVIVPVSLAVAWLGVSLGSEVRRALVIGAIVVVVTAGYSYSAASASHRAELSFHNVVGVRVLTDSELTKWFSHHGMPLDRALRTRTGKSGLDDDFYLSRDPAFAKYRHWARHGGPRALVISLIVLAPHYDHLLYDDLPLILKGDVSFYDTQSVYDAAPAPDAAPTRRSEHAQGPHHLAGTRRGCARDDARARAPAWSRLRPRRVRRDRVVPRTPRDLHDVGRRSGRDAASPDRRAQPPLTHADHRRGLRGRRRRRSFPLRGARAAERPGRRVGHRRCVTSGCRRRPTSCTGSRRSRSRSSVGVTLIGNRIHAAGNDAVFTQSLVNRAARFGGTYYQNGISPKGPFEDVAHDIALRVGGYDGHWYVISIMIAISAVLIGAAAAKTAMTTGGNRHVGLAVAAIVFIHFTLSDAPYAGLLYSRNILETLLAVGVAPHARRPRVDRAAADPAERRDRDRRATRARSADHSSVALRRDGDRDRGAPPHRPARRRRGAGAACSAAPPASPRSPRS